MAGIRAGQSRSAEMVSDCEGYLSEEPVEMYDEADWDAVEKHIEKYFGHYDYVFHESVSTGIHLDICVIPPRKDHNYYTLLHLEWALIE